MMDKTCDIKNIELANKGKNRIEWAWGEMPVLAQIKDRFEKDNPLSGLRVSACLHVTTETANLCRTLKAGGAEVVLCASNPLSTQDDVAASLVKDFEIPVYAIRGENTETYYQHIESAISHRPHITLDDGADLVSQLHKCHPEVLDKIIGGTEETTTGVIRLRAMAKDNALLYPIVAVNDAYTKHLFDNRYGTGQSSLDGVIRATNILLAGRNFTVVGYGWCGRGLATRAQGHGSHVYVCEVNPLRALEATMDGFKVLPIEEAAKISDFMITATGNKHVIDDYHFSIMKSGCILANTGHFNVEINIDALEKLSIEKKRFREHIDEYSLKDGRKIRLLAEGRLVNLAAAEGHPASVMDMSFANQALAVEFLAQNANKLEATVLSVPSKIDQKVAELKLKALGVKIDTLTNEQKAYLTSWEEGTS